MKGPLLDKEGIKGVVGVLKLKIILRNVIFDWVYFSGSLL